MSQLTLTLNGTRIGRTSLALAHQEYLRQVETDAARLESQLWQLVELRPALKASYCDQWWAMIGRMEQDAAKKTGLTVAIETPSWIVLMQKETKTERQNEPNKQCVPGDAGRAAQGTDRV